MRLAHLGPAFVDLLQPLAPDLDLALNKLLRRPDGNAAKEQSVKMQHASPSDNVSFTQPFGACKQVDYDGCRDDEAHNDMPVQQIEPGKVHLCASDPADARDKRQCD